MLYSAPAKDNIANVKFHQEFALFLKKRSQLEEEHANGMKKLCHISNNTMRRPEHREGTWAQAYEDTMIVHDRMCENSLQFAASLHHMHEDLIEMAAIAEKSRKGWKQSGLSAEQRIHELEAAMKKSKAKYDQLAQDYERVKMGDSRGGSKGFFKSSKSAAQQEEELLHKVQTADQDYRSRVDAVLQERASVTSTARPDAVKALQDLVRECDAGLTLQLQKFASFNEKLLLSNGLTISPIKGQGSSGRSLREIASSVNNEKDARDFIMGQYKVLPPRTPEPKYERNPVLNPTATQPIHPGPMMGQQPTHHHGPGMGQASIHPMTTSGQQQPTLQGGAAIPGPQRMRQSSGAGSMQSPPGSSTGSPMPPTKIGAGGPGFGSSSQGPGPQRSLPQQQQQYDRNFSHENLMGNSQSTMSQQQQSGRNTAGSGARFNSGNLPSLQPGQGQSPQNQVVPQPVTQGPFPGHQQSQLLGQQSRGSSPLGAGQSSPRQKPMPFPNNALPANSQADSGPQSAQAAASRSVSPPSAPIAPPSRPVFGVSLERLYERDGIPVPMVVYRCIQAVDLFGLNVEGIYRLSGSQIHVQKLRMLFDTVGADGNSPDTDFRNPENFFHDVNSVAGLLKQFFRDLPDPVLTKAMYNEFIRAASKFSFFFLLFFSIKLNPF